MKDLVARKDFVPEATWLAVYQSPGDSRTVPVGTIQGLRTADDEGAIQNIGIVPGFRGLGLGTALIWRTLAGFAAAGCQTASLEVTVHNSSAIRLYERIGFHKTCTVFKVGEVSFA
jgi:ribosomal protein S18 acetylase RimI-like enzyme